MYFDLSQKYAVSPDWDESIKVGRLQLNLIRVLLAFERDMKIKSLSVLHAEVQQAVCTAGLRHVVLKLTFSYSPHERKHTEEVGFARSVGPDEYVDSAKLELVDLGDASETPNGNAVEFRHIAPMGAGQ